MSTPTTTSPTAGTPGARRRRPFSFDRFSFFAVFLVVPLAIYTLFVLWPIAQAFWLSLTSWNGYTAVAKFVGFGTYRQLFNDPLFWTALRNNFIMALVLPIVTIVLALTLATLITVGGSSKGGIRGISGAGFYRVVSFFPYAIPAVVTGILWSQIYSPQGGLLNGILVKLGFDQFQNKAWLGDSNTALIAIMVVITWSFVGFYMVLFIAGIKSIPAEVYEAARLDGAGRFTTAARITIPMIKDNISTAAVYLAIVGLDGFTYMMVLTPSGGPENSTLVVSQFLFNNFNTGHVAYGIAAGVVLALITLLVSVIVLGLSRRKDDA